MKFFCASLKLNRHGVLINTTLHSEIENLKTLFAQTPEMFCITSGPLHKFEFVNKAHIKALGFDATGMEVRVAQPESVEVHGILDDVYNTGVTADLHEIPVTLGTSIRYFDLTYAAKRDVNGKINGIMILGNEVTNRVLIDQKLAHERKRLFSFLEQIPAAIAILSGPDFIYELTNSYYQNLVGKRELLGRALYEAFPDLTKEVYNLLKKVVDDNEGFAVYEFPIELDWENNGVVGLRYLNLYYEPYRNAEGRAEGVLAFVYDITEQVLSKDRVTNALKVRDEFLSIASHELKTPLTSLNLQIQSSQKRLERKLHEEFTMEKLQILFGKYKKQTDRLISLVDDMLDLSRINLGKLSYEFEHCDLRGIVETSFDNIRQQFEDKNCPLVVKTPEIQVMGNFDKQRMEQVLTNLLTNALKYGEGKMVNVDIVLKNSKACICVVDHGLGIEKENLEKIFQKFERIDATLDISGLGIGLYITKEIVDAHQGRVWAESTIGEGSTFIVELPIDSLSG